MEQNTHFNFNEFSERIKKIDFEEFRTTMGQADLSSWSAVIFVIDGVERCTFSFEKAGTIVYPNLTSHDIRFFGHNAGIGGIIRFDDLFNSGSSFKIPIGHYGFQSFELNRPSKKIRRSFTVSLNSFGTVKNIFDTIKIRNGIRNEEYTLNRTKVALIQISLSSGKPVINKLFEKELKEKTFDLDINL